MSFMKPYQRVPIQDCGEPLVPIPLAEFAVEEPHPYVKLGAPYGDHSPYYLRQGVLEQLIQAQRLLQQSHRQWRIQIFDAYRPIAVQQFMVNHALAEAVQAGGLSLTQLTDAQKQAFLDRVQQFWAVPSLDPATPPPHSTGAAIDVTLVDERGQPVDMGSPIDEMSPRSYPDYYANWPATPAASAPLAQSGRYALFHQHRQLLRQVMTTAGFEQHPQEWWHFSLGDQLWAWLVHQRLPEQPPLARYGAI
ncbi:MAG: D-alanyl-D-alanine dipeptidase [Synechococcales cyanobacterium C42_A2020_086]|nr:D-alanyl-D-alanine dipeptidase [Synechococcales cyanobacterium C42_A2020_086]